MSDIGSILLILALAVLVGVALSLPFFDRRKGNQKLITHRASSESEQKRSALLAERDRLLAALQELEFDTSMGKVDAEGYSAQRNLLIQNGAVTLRELDEVEGFKPAVEEEVQEKPTAEEDELEALIARHKNKQGKGRVCRKCGSSIRPSDRFCSKCGTVV